MLADSEVEVRPKEIQEAVDQLENTANMEKLSGINPLILLVGGSFAGFYLMAVAMTDRLYPGGPILELFR